MEKEKCTGANRVEYYSENGEVSCLCGGTEFTVNSANYETYITCTKCGCRILVHEG